MPPISDRAYLKQEMAKRELARKSYRWYLYYVHGQQWRRTKMSDFLADTVQKFVEEDTGNAYDILLIETPPQHGKSITITESFPSWYLGRYPKNRVIEASYNDDTAKKFGRKNLDKVEEFGKALFGMERGSIWNVLEFELSNGWGRMISRGIMSGITGNPANLLIIDDPVKNRAEADSQTYRDKLWNEWQNTLKSRLAAKAKVIIIMTPWHEDDLAARILANEPTATLIRLPIEAEELDLLGRPVGDALAPELGKDNAWLAQFKASYLNDPTNGGMRAWQALYQCSPRTEGGNIVRREWWRYYDPKDITAFGSTVISVDATFKDAATNDFVAIEVWSKLGNNYYLRYCMNRHLDFPNTVQAIRLVKKLFPEAQHILIEDKANGSAIIQTLRSEFVGVIAITPKGGKVSRVNAVAPAIESGNVYVPLNTTWAEELVDQFSAFPAGKHDDMCFAAGTKIATPFGDKRIEDFKPGDKVITPFGVDVVERAFCSGEKDVITKYGVTATPDHPFFTYENIFNTFQSLTGSVHCSTISLREMILWKYRKLLFSMASHTDSWELGSIISASPRVMKAADMRKDFMSRFGNFIAGRKFLPAMKFIIKTAILLITTSVTLSVYRVSNIASSLSRRTPRSRRHIWKESENLQRNGTALKKGTAGMSSTEKTCSQTESRPSLCASSVENLSSPSTTTRSSVLTTAPSKVTTGTKLLRKIGSALSAESRSRQKSGPGTTALSHAAESAEHCCAVHDKERSPGTTVSAPPYTRHARSAEKSLTTSPRPTITPGMTCAVADPAPRSAGGRRKEKVYNLTVKRSHLYYAGGFLVHNCDAASQALNYMLFTNGQLNGLPSDEAAALGQRLLQEQERFLGDGMYDVYGGYGDLY